MLRRNTQSAQMILLILATGFWVLVASGALAQAQGRTASDELIDAVVYYLNADCALAIDREGRNSLSHLDRLLLHASDSPKRIALVQILLKLLLNKDLDDRILKAVTPYLEKAWQARDAQYQKRKSQYPDALRVSERTLTRESFLQKEIKWLARIYEVRAVDGLAAIRKKFPAFSNQIAPALKEAKKIAQEEGRTGLANAIEAALEG